MFGVNYDNMFRVLSKIKTLTNIIQSYIEKLVNLLLFSTGATFFLIAFFLIAYTFNLFIYPFMKISEDTLVSMNISVTLVLVAITAIYVFFTGQIVSESRKETKIAYIEKRLEKLYYPLQDFMKSHTVFALYYCDEIMEASAFEFLNEEKAESEGMNYIRPADCILNDCDVQNNSVKRYDLDSVIPYKYLATKELLEQLELILNDFRDINPYEVASSDPEFKNRIDKIKEIIINDINSLIEEHTKLL